MKQVLKEYGLVMGISLLAALGVRFFLVEPYSISSPSMAPSLLPGDQVLIAKFPYSFSNPLPERGKVVLVAPPEDPHQYYFRRVIGLPGDTVEIAQGEVLLNKVKIRLPNSQSSTMLCWPEFIGKTSFEACKGSSEPLTAHEITVPPDSVLVVSDHRTQLSGPFQGWRILPKGSIRGEAQLIWLSIDPETELSMNLFSRLRLNRIFSKVGS